VSAVAMRPRPARRRMTPTVRLRQIAGSPRFARLLAWVTFVVVWQLAIPLLPTLLVPTPAEVAEFMWDEVRGDTLAPQTVWEAFGTSLGRLGTGLLIAFAIGVPVGLLMGLSKKANWFGHDFVVAGLAMPSLVWALIAAMWFGFGTTAPVITVVLAAVTFVVINIAEGVRNVPKDLLDMGGAYAVPRARLIRHVIFPSLMPFFFAALRYGLANAWKGLVLAELFASTNGAGWMIKFWYDAHRAQGIVGYALFFVIFALIVERLVFGRLSAYVFRWRPQANAAAPPEPDAAAPAPAPTPASTETREPVAVAARTEGD
jgi:ABC-type nitrate/sulfonate/bicarbonate transport system permease component